MDNADVNSHRAKPNRLAHMREFIALILLNVFLFVQLVGFTDQANHGPEGSVPVAESYLSPAKASGACATKLSLEIVTVVVNVLAAIEPREVDVVIPDTYLSYFDEPDPSGLSSRGPPSV